MRFSDGSVESNFLRKPCDAKCDSHAELRAIEGSPHHLLGVHDVIFVGSGPPVEGIVGHPVVIPLPLNLLLALVTFVNLLGSVI